MSGLIEGFAAILSGNAFANAFWVFVGIVSGAIIQHLLGWINQASQRKYAKTALKTEIDLNLDEIKHFLTRIDFLRSRISAGQINENDLFISMQGFDYSIVNPLVMSGHFHVMLGHEKVSRYFSFMRFFNAQNSHVINSNLRMEHERMKSLDYLSGLQDETERLSFGLEEVRHSVGGYSAKMTIATPKNLEKR
ncbi:hypothetical protein J2X53_000795 [Pseudorhodobacter sp. 4114]|nr:hypothetical protein [Pseudorhodobacter sp. 4114]